MQLLKHLWMEKVYIYNLLFINSSEWPLGPLLVHTWPVSSLGHILGICSPTRPLHLEQCNCSQHLFVSAEETSGFNDTEHPGLQSSCRCGKCKTRIPEAPGAVLCLGSDL